MRRTEYEIKSLKDAVVSLPRQAKILYPVGSTPSRSWKLLDYKLEESQLKHSQLASHKCSPAE